MTNDMMQVEFAGEGCERASVQAYPVAEARRYVEMAREMGREASWAPDCEDSSVAWVYEMSEA